MAHAHARFHPGNAFAMIAELCAVAALPILEILDAIAVGTHPFIVHPGAAS
jgi:hypothetical protein